MKVSVQVLANDTTATLMSEPLKMNDFPIGVVLGTGTNAAYFKSRGQEHCMATNVEWASFDAHSLKITKYDKDIQDDLEKKGKSWKRLDCMLGGYKFLEILNRSSGDILPEKFDYTLENVKEIIERGDEDDEKYKHIKQVKTRTMKIISALIFAILELEKVSSETTISLILNGTIFEQKFDVDLLKHEIQNMCAHYGKGIYKYANFNFPIPRQASLLGIIRILAENVMSGDNH